MSNPDPYQLPWTDWISGNDWWGSGKEPTKEDNESEEETE